MLELSILFRIVSGLAQSKSCPRKEAWRANSPTNRHGMEDVYRLQKTQQGYKEGSIDEMLERLAKHSYFCFLDGYSGYHQIPIHPNDQSKATFTCPYGTYAYRRMSFGLCNALVSFQRCMMSIFSNMKEGIMEVFMDSFLVYGMTFNHCPENLDRVLQRCQEKDLILNWSWSWSVKALF